MSESTIGAAGAPQTETTAASSPDFSDGRPVIYFGGYLNGQKHVNRVAERLTVALGAEVLGRTALWAFRHPTEVRELVEGDSTGIEDDAAHVIVNSASGAALVNANPRTMASFTSVETTKPTPIPMAMWRLGRLLWSQDKKANDPQRSVVERKAYNASKWGKLKEGLSHPIGYMRYLGKVAGINVLNWEGEIAQKGVPVRDIRSTYDEMYEPPTQNEIEAAQAKGVDVVVVANDPKLDHEGIVVNTEVAAKYITGQEAGSNN